MSGMIRPGERLPSVQVRRISADGMEQVDFCQWLGEGKTIFFSVPGAFTPTCHNDHLPGFVSRAANLKAAGIDRLVCATVNDHHVVKAWAESRSALTAMDFIADFDGALAKGLGLAKDMSQGGLGWRFMRAALIIEDGTVQELFVDDKPGQMTNTSASAILSLLAD